jgi:environmental stress-induced protein Ves
MSLPVGLSIEPLASFASHPWRNGGGTTRAFVEETEGGWRISLADVARDGPYSRFPGMDRLSLVIQGEGIDLQGPGRGTGTDVVALEPGHPAQYDGGIAWQATLRDGPVVALNAMALRDRFRARIVLLREATFIRARRFALVLPMNRSCAWHTTDRAATLLESDAVLMRSMNGPDLTLLPLASAAHGIAAALVLIEPLTPIFSENEGNVT